MKILISGAAGMVGSHCAEFFSPKNKIVAVDNLMRSKIFGSNKKSVEFNWNYLEKFKNIKKIKKDVRDRDDMIRLFRKEKPDVVIHTAAQPGVRYSLENSLDDFDINALGTINLLDALRRVNSKGIFIYCSTNKVYGDNVNELAIKENKTRYQFKSSKGVKEDMSIDLTGHTPYGVSKLTGDLYVQDYAHTYKLRTAVFRMSCIYGIRQFGFEDQGWLAWFAVRFLKNLPVTIYGNGKQVRDVLWVEDLIKAYDGFIRSNIKSDVFNVGGGYKNTLSLLELMEILKKVSQKNIKVNFSQWRKFDQKVYISDITKIKNKLGWAPKVSPSQGVEALYRWILNNKKYF